MNDDRVHDIVRDTIRFMTTLVDHVGPTEHDETGLIVEPIVDFAIFDDFTRSELLGVSISLAGYLMATVGEEVTEMLRWVALRHESGAIE